MFSSFFAFLSLSTFVSSFGYSFLYFISIVPQNGWTALHWAAELGRVEIVKILLKCDEFAEINAQGYEVCFRLIFVVSIGNI
jgi:hypothetical protein